MSDILDLINSNVDWVSKRAKLVKEVGDNLTSGKITKDEATELMQNIMDTDLLNEEANDIKLKTELIEAVKLFADNLGLILSL